MKLSDMGKIQGFPRNSGKLNLFSSDIPCLLFAEGLSLAGPGARLDFPHLPCDPVSSAHGSCEMSVPKIYFPEEQTKAPPSSATGVCCPNTISKRFGIWAPESGL